MEGVEAPKYMRHDFTDELVGRAYTRSWGDNMTSMHLYTTPHSASWTIYTDDQTLGMQWCAPCIYTKLRDGVYIFNLVEEACDGIETCIVINDKTMHVCGFEFEGGSRGGGPQCCRGYRASNRMLRCKAFLRTEGESERSVRGPSSK
jgi:hypothetical protein